TNSKTIGLIGFMRTVADITGAQIPSNAGEDSISFLPALLGNQSLMPSTETLILESGSGQFGLRSNNWMYIDSRTGDGHNPELEPLWFKESRGYSSENTLPALLYDLGKDLAERTNLLNARPTIATRLSTQLRQQRAISTWKGAFSGNWSVTSNWLPNRLPYGADIVYSNVSHFCQMSQTLGASVLINSVNLDS